VGEMVLTAPSLQDLFTKLYNMPIVPFTRFNNTVVMGSGVVAFALSPFVYFLAKIMVSRYRDVFLARLKQTKAWKAMQATSLYKWYYKYEQYEW
ncbi:MAG: DUF2062 domain-containing protein, partial [Bdellovibrionales bacterium]|nr:DUF2062 domain-containing protein [Bdellovibrionales bacterium]